MKVFEVRPVIERYETAEEFSRQQFCCYRPRTDHRHLPQSLRKQMTEFSKFDKNRQQENTFLYKL